MRDVTSYSLQLPSICRQYKLKTHHRDEEEEADEGGEGGGVGLGVRRVAALPVRPVGALGGRAQEDGEEGLQAHHQEERQQEHAHALGELPATGRARERHTTRSLSTPTQQSE
jgi:hypothetical protein